VNTGGVIFAAQARLVPTPRELRNPEDRLGNAAAVAQWVGGNAVAFRDLSVQRAEAGEKWRREAISRNVREEVDLLASERGRCRRPRRSGLSTAPGRRQSPHPHGARIGHGPDAWTLMFPAPDADIGRGSSCEPKRPQRWVTRESSVVGPPIRRPT